MSLDKRLSIIGYPNAVFIALGKKIELNLCSSAWSWPYSGDIDHDCKVICHVISSKNPRAPCIYIQKSSMSPMIDIHYIISQFPLATIRFFTIVLNELKFSNAFFRKGCEG
jgi:hypothetical protein